MRGNSDVENAIYLTNLDVSKISLKQSPHKRSHLRLPPLGKSPDKMRRSRVSDLQSTALGFNKSELNVNSQKISERSGSHENIPEYPPSASVLDLKD